MNLSSPLRFLRRHLAVAVVVMLACSATATATSLITGAAVADGSLTGADVADGSIDRRDLAPGSVGTSELAPGAVRLRDMSPTTREVIRDMQRRIAISLGSDGELREGDSDRPGADGSSGPAGAPGATGAAGASGPAGAVGPAGPAGADGAAGPAGADGAAGLDGIDGQDGIVSSLKGLADSVPVDSDGINFAPTAQPNTSAASFAITASIQLTGGPFDANVTCTVEDGVGPIDELTRMQSVEAGSRQVMSLSGIHTQVETNSYSLTCSTDEGMTMTVENASLIAVQVQEPQSMLA